MQVPAACAAFFSMAAAAMAAGQIDTVNRDGLVVSWEARRLPAPADARRLVDHSGQENEGSFVGNVRTETDPARLELDGKAAVVAEKPIRPERLTLEAVFRIDHTRAPLQLINKIALILEHGGPATVQYWDLVLP